MTLVLLSVGCFAASYVLTGIVRTYALRRAVLDVPNERSSHRVPTPRGGGVAVGLGALAGIIILAATGSVPWTDVWGIGGAGAFVAVVGFVDDHGHVARRWRLLAHLAAAAWVLWWLPASAWLAGSEPSPWVGAVVGVAAGLYVAWMLNLTNFMDGVDGLASTEAVTVCLMGAGLGWQVAPGFSSWPLAVVTAAAAGGFLLWNWPPARIFLGDAGSGFLGLTMGSLALRAGSADPALLLSWTILLGAFVVDATVTLAVRLLTGQPILEPHRSHAYQHAAQRLGSHLAVTAAVACINLFWLGPWAWAVARGHVDGLLGVLAAYTPLLILTGALRAGQTQGELGL